MEAIFSSFYTVKDIQVVPSELKSLPRGIIQSRSDLELKPLWATSSSRSKDKLAIHHNLLAMPVGIKQKENVDAIVQKMANLIEFVLWTVSRIEPGTSGTNAIGPEVSVIPSKAAEQNVSAAPLSSKSKNKEVKAELSASLVSRSANAQDVEREEGEWYNGTCGSCFEIMYGKARKDESMELNRVV